MKFIYFDNAATSWPKPSAVMRTINEYQKKSAANPGRSGHRMSLAAARTIFNTRSRLANFFGSNDVENIIFTMNATQSLNIAVCGFFKPGDNIITSSVEHNSVMRPLNAAQKRDITFTVVKCSETGEIDLDDIVKSIKKNTKAIIWTAASNVTGTIMPLKEIGNIAKKYGLVFCVDAVQAAGILPLDVNDIQIDFLAFTGHKSLFGTQGSGGFYIRKGLEKKLEQIFTGGTGSKSESEEHPDFMPDRYEAGTPNGIGIAGLGAGIDFINSVGIDAIFKHEQNLVGKFISEIKSNKKIKLYGPLETEKRIGIASFNIEDKSPSEVSEQLDNKYSIMSRAGLHCAPAAHKTVNSFPQGSVRFSFSFFNNEKQIDKAVKALYNISKR